MDIIVSNLDSKPIYEQIYTQVKQLILAGKLKEGDPLPSIRLLAKELRISVITTKRAYEELERDGFVMTVQGKGSFVGHSNPDFIREEHLKHTEELAEKIAEEAKTAGMSKKELLELIEMVYEQR